MKTGAEQMLEDLSRALADIETDIARFENPDSLRPHDEEGIRAIEQRLSGVKEQLDSASWTSDAISEKIKSLSLRVAKLREE